MCSECMRRTADRPAVLSALGAMRQALDEFLSEVVAGGDEYDRGYRNGMKQQIRTVERMAEERPCPSQKKG